MAELFVLAGALKRGACELLNEGLLLAVLN